MWSQETISSPVPGHTDENTHLDHDNNRGKFMYITYWNPPKTRQITFDEILNGVVDVNQIKNYGDKTSTLTVSRKDLTKKLRAITNVPKMVSQLKEFNDKYVALEAEQDLSQHYRHFYLPKKSGGWRPIDAPDKILGDALTELRELLKSFMIADYHTAAHAYIENRSILTAVRTHQKGHLRWVTNPETGEREQKVFENNWGASFDLHAFFPSVTMEFLMGTLSTIYPFALIMETQYGRQQLSKALKIAFLHGGLPQGSQLSPWLTNVFMIPFDYMMSRKLRKKYRMRDGVERDFTYTRYADDIDISCYLSFDPTEIEDLIKNILNFMHAPFTLNEKKTHYGNRHSSKNWMLGLMWNKDNEITVGWRNLKTFKAQCVYYIDAKKHGKDWTLEDVQSFMGTINYYHMVEPDVIDGIIHRINDKFGVDLIKMVKADLRPKEGEVA